MREDVTNTVHIMADGTKETKCMRTQGDIDNNIDVNTYLETIDN